MTKVTNPTQDNAATSAEHIRPLANFRYALRKFLSFSEACAERYGVATQQYQLMQVIATMPADSIASITYLADRMVLRHNSMVELVDRAERAGLVRRETDVNDLRRSLVVLTPTGQGVLSGMIAEHLAELKSVGPELIATLRGALDEAGRTEGAATQ